MPTLIIDREQYSEINAGVGSEFDVLDFDWYAHNIFGTASGNTFDLSGIASYASGLQGYFRFDMGAGNDVFYGTGDGDEVNGGSGDDTLHGNAGDDTLSGDAGTNTLYGGAGNDLLIAGERNITSFYGGDGEDTVDFESIGNTIENIDLSASRGIEVLDLTNVIIDGTAGQNIFDFTGLLSVQNSENAILNLLGGDDIFRGSRSGEQVDGGAGNDYLVGNGGDDTLSSGSGDDTLIGGNGDDYFYLSNGSSSVVFDGGEGEDTVDLPLLGVALRTFDLSSDRGVEVLDLTNTEVSGTVRRDTFDFSGLNEVVNGINTEITLMAGDDRFTGSNDAEFVNGGADDDHLRGRGGNDWLIGGLGQDTIIGGAGNDVLGVSDNVYDMEASSDVLQGGRGDDELNLAYGSVFSELTLDRRASVETINFYEPPMSPIIRVVPLTGTSGSDTIDVSGVRHLETNYRSETLFDLLSGNDRFTGSRDNDVVDLGSGDDRCASRSGDDEVSGGGGNDTINGGNGNDLLFGNTGNDELVGGAGSDQIVGDDGNDKLVGGSGNDTLYGGNGSDTIVGNRGADTFVFTGGRDVVRDFTVGEDILDVSNSDFWQLRPRELLNDYAHQRGESVVLNYEGERIVLRGVDLDDLSASDFIFS